MFFCPISSRTKEGETIQWQCFLVSLHQIAQRVGISLGQGYLGAGHSLYVHEQIKQLYMWYILYQYVVSVCRSSRNQTTIVKLM